MKTLVILIAVLLNGLALGQLNTDMNRKPPKIEPPKFQTEVVDYFGDKRMIWDHDQDGWDDLWCMIHQNIKHRSIYTDTDEDGVTDYEEMILWRDPFIKGPLPKKLTPEELAEAEKKNKERREKQLALERERWTAFKNAKAKALNGTRVIDKEKLKQEEKEKHDEMLRKAETLPPIWVKPHNATGALKAGISQLFPGGGQETNFTGFGQTIASIEPSRPYPHYAFSSRVEWETYFGTLAEPDYHTTRVLGTMIGDGTGNIAAKGAAPSAAVQMYRSEFVGFSYPKAAQEHDISNTSNGEGAGWSGTMFVEEDGTTFPYWQSRLFTSVVEPNYCGLYTEISALVDETMTTHQEHLSVFSAGNDGSQTIPVLETGDYFYADDENGVARKYQVIGTEGPGKAGAADNGFDTLPQGFPMAKNPLIVGGINMGDEPYDLGSKGPTDDGRIKPDVVAKATSMTTTDGLQGFVSGGTIHGTSYAAPIIAGGLAVMQQAIQENPVTPSNYRARGSTKKALVIHEAQDLGNPGPDYTFGWGAPVFANSVYVIQRNSEAEGSPLIKETFVTPNSPVEIKVRVGVLNNPNSSPGGPQHVLAPQPLKVTIAWTDPKGPAPISVYNTLDNRTPVLVNDLDLEVVQVVEEGEEEPDPFLPWVLDVENPSAPATSGVNNVDNVEQVIIDYAYGEYIIKVSANGPLQGGRQNVSIIITGIALDGSTSVPESGYVVPSGGGVNEVFLGWTAPVGVEYNLQSSSDLVTWETEVENLTTNNGQIGYIVPTGPDTKKFWRLAW